MNTNVIDSFSHNPYDYNTGMIDWWDEGVNGSYDTFAFTIADQLLNSMIKPLTDYELYEQEEEEEIIVPEGYVVFTIPGPDGEEQLFTDSNGNAFLTLDAAEALGL